MPKLEIINFKMEKFQNVVTDKKCYINRSFYNPNHISTLMLDVWNCFSQYILV